MNKSWIASAASMLCLAVFLLFVACTKKQPPIVVATTGECAPFVLKDKNGELIGFEVDIIKMMAKSLKRDVEFRCGTFEEVFTDVRSKKADLGVAGISITSERKNLVDFSPGYHSGGFVLLLPDTAVVNGLEDLKDKTIGVRSGTWQENVAKSSWEKNIRNLFVKSFDKLSEEDIVEKLHTGELAAVVLDIDEAKYLIKARGGMKFILLDAEVAEIGAITLKGSAFSKVVFDWISQNKDKVAEIEVKWFSAKS